MTMTPLDQLVHDVEAIETGEPGDIQAGTYVQKPQAGGDETDPGKPGAMVTDLVSAGYSILYDTRSAEASVVNNNMVPSQLKATRVDGSLVFQRNKPPFEPWRGSIKCFLHKDSPDRAKYDEMGFGVCAKETLPNVFQAENHARNRHRDEWRAVESDRGAREREEDRAVQRALLQSVAGRTEVNVAVAEPPVQVQSGQCVQCDWKSDARKRASRKMSLARHVEQAHG